MKEKLKYYYNNYSTQTKSQIKYSAKGQSNIQIHTYDKYISYTQYEEEKQKHKMKKKSRTKKKNLGLNEFLNEISTKNSKKLTANSCVA